MPETWLETDVSCPFKSSVLAVASSRYFIVVTLTIPKVCISIFSEFFLSIMAKLSCFSTRSCDFLQEYQAIVDAEWNILYDKLEKIYKSGAKVVLSKLPIGDVATQYFADRDLFCAGRVVEEDLKRTMMVWWYPVFMLSVSFRCVSLLSWFNSSLILNWGKQSL